MNQLINTEQAEYASGIYVLMQILHTDIVMTWAIRC
jgi:hypothetical protein